jgi:hypothetical protein
MMEDVKQDMQDDRIEVTPPKVMPKKLDALDESLVSKARGTNFPL